MFHVPRRGFYPLIGVGAHSARPRAQLADVFPA